MATRSHPTLGAERTLSLVSDRWFILIVHGLMDGPRRYAELQRAVPGVTKKMLTETLRTMERDGLVSRKAYPVVPPHTEYALTELGQSLVKPLQLLCAWGNENFHLIEENRRQSDEAGKPAIS